MENRGFTLIELMITIAILAIIVAIAVPAYQNQIQKTRRADGQSALLSAAQQLERCYTTKNTYDSCFDTTLSQDGFYSVSLVTAESDGNSYKLQAIPQGGQTKDSCGTLTLDHLGRKDKTGDGTGCWGGS